MNIDFQHPSFVVYCNTKTSMEVFLDVTGKNLRGLDKLAYGSLHYRKKLPAAIVNVLLVYFYQTFANTVYHRNDLGRMYDYWVKQEVRTFDDALEMTKMDIQQIL